MNFFTTTYRHLKKRKAYTLLEVCSLTIGLVCVLLSLLYLKRETGFDRSFANHERIFRVNHFEESSGNRYSGTPSALGFHANQEIPQAKEVVRVFYPSPHVLDRSIGRAQYGYPVLRGQSHRGGQ